MNLESEIFSNYLIREDRLLDYGIQPEGEGLTFRKPLPEDHMEIVLTYDGALRGQILDLAAGEEYLNFRNERAAGYGAGIRQKFLELLLDIRENCCKNQHFRSPQARRICESMEETYDCTPEFLWPSIPSYAAFRRKGTKKWFAVMGSVPMSKLDPDFPRRGDVEVVNVKVDSGQIREILGRPGCYPAFHMNKKCWVSLILDDTLPDGEIQARIADSFERV